MTFGDVIAYVAVLATLLFTLWAAILVTGLVFGAKTQHAAQLLESAPGKAMGIGVGLALLGIGLGLGLVNTKNGLFMLIGWVVLAITLCIAMVGSAGLARVVSGRMQTLAPHQSALSLLARGGALLIATGALPAVGWFLLFPLQLFASLGAGFQALSARERRAYEQPAAQPQTNQQ